MTRILNLMEKKGYIRRVPDEHDKRRYNIFLTKKSREIEDKLISTVIDFAEKAFSGLTQRQIIEMQKVHEQIIGNGQRSVFSLISNVLGFQNNQGK